MSLIESDIIRSLPDRLKQFVVEQDYDRYTSREQACWRYYMKVQWQHLGSVAHEIYQEGIQKRVYLLSIYPVSMR